MLQSFRLALDALGILASCKVGDALGDGVARFLYLRSDYNYLF